MKTLHDISFLTVTTLLTCLAKTLPAADLAQSILGEEVVFAEADGLVAVEAEHFFKQTLTDQRAWHITSSKAAPEIKPDGDPAHIAGASAGAYVEVLPDTRRTHGDKLIGGENFSNVPGQLSVLHYKVHFDTPGRYYVWVRAYSSGSEDNGLHVGLNGAWPESGQRLQWCEGKNSWRWESKQRTQQNHCGEPYKIFLEINKPGEHTVMFSMREDGFEFDKWLMTLNRELERPQDAGPPGQVKKGTLPAPFPVVAAKFVTFAKPAAPSAKPAKPAKPLAPLVMPRKPDGKGTVEISGELKQWHKVTLTLDGPFANERDNDPNPFKDYNLTVRFTHESGQPSYHVPGYFAADGNAANTSAESGTTWQAHLSPDRTGKWNYSVSFRSGAGVAIEKEATVGQGVKPYDGLSGSFIIAKTDKTGRDNRAKGRLQYVGKHHLQFAGNGEYLVKAGADAPENLLAYAEFDGDFKKDGHSDHFIKTWQAHVRDWKPGDPTWGAGKGKGLIGAINYLASKGMNVFSFLTLNIAGDDKNVFPYLDYNERLRFDVSRLDQWEILFDHADMLGMYLHFKLFETENQALLDKGNVGPQFKLYCREIMARYGHHLALNWNVGEENTQPADKRIAKARHLSEIDPYHHHIVVHNGKSPGDMLGDKSKATGYSLQTGWNNVFRATREWVNRSAAAGKPWVVASDEQNSPSDGVITDAEDYWHDGIRKETLWGNLMAGGGGVEYYFGYKHPHSDLTCEDFRSRDHMWDLSRHALEFFYQYLPFWEMKNNNSKLSNKDAFLFAKPGKVYAAYLKNGGTSSLDLKEAEGVFEVAWYNPREGGPLRIGSVSTAQGGMVCDLGHPPDNPGKDWAVLVRPADPNRNYPPGVNAGENRTLMLPKNAGSIKIKLAGTVTDDDRPSKTLTTSWARGSGPDSVRFDAPGSAETSVTFSKPGVYVLKLSSSDGTLSSSDTVTFTIEPYSPRVTQDYKTVADAFLEGGKGQNTEQLKVEGTRRVAYLKFDVKGLPTNCKTLKATLTLTENGDTGNGTLRAYKGVHSNWTEDKLGKSSAPAKTGQVGLRNGAVGSNQSIEMELTPLITGNGIYTVILMLDQGGNDIWFGSSESTKPPKLTITAEDLDAK